MHEQADDLTSIPGVGPKIARNLRLIGVQRVRDLKGANPEKLYRKLERTLGEHVDRCGLYVLRGAVYFASHERHDPHKLKWWNWKDQPAPSLKDAAVEFLTLVARGEVSEAYDRHIGPGFRHHNAYFPGGAASLKRAMQDDAIENPGKRLEVHRALQDGNEVAVLSRIRQRAAEHGWAVVHIFRFKRGKIAEMWDVGQAIPNESPNENGPF